MLNKEQVKEILDTFFGGNPEKAYTMVNDINEWEQAMNSIKKEENDDRSYWIMANSDLTNFYKIQMVKADRSLPRYDVGY